MAPIAGIVCCAASAQAADFFVDSQAGNDANDGSKDHPWQTMSRLAMQTLAPGDSIAFAKGSTFDGSLELSASGTEAAPIVVKSYGSGVQPLFTNSDPTLNHGNVFLVSGSWTVIQDLHFAQTVTEMPNTPNATDDAFVKQSGAVFIAPSSEHATVAGCEMSDTPLGVQALGSFTTIRSNYIHDCSRFLDSPNWGPIGVMLASSDHEVSYNRIQNMVAVGGTFGADGGAFELDNTSVERKNIYIHHNYSSGNEGFLEVSPNGPVSDSVVAYNFSDDIQEFIFFWAGSNFKVINNTVLRTRPANSMYNTVFQITSKSQGNVIENNIFVVGGGVKAFNYANNPHHNNLLLGVDKSAADPAGGTLDPTDKIGDPQFVDLAGGDFRLKPSSPAIDAGKSEGCARDFFNDPVPHGSAPDIGAVELTDCLASGSASSCPFPGTGPGFVPAGSAMDCATLVGPSGGTAPSFGGGSGAGGGAGSGASAGVRPSAGAPETAAAAQDNSGGCSIPRAGVPTRSPASWAVLALTSLLVARRRTASTSR